MNRIKTIRFLLFGVAIIVLLAACQGSDPSLEPTEPGAPAPTIERPEITAPSPEPTSAPEPTAAPPQAEAPESGDGEGLPQEAVWIGLGLLLIFLLIGWLMGRSRKSAPVPVAATPEVTWKDHTRGGYAQARWLYDSLTEDLAVWRGNALFEGKSESGTAAGTSLAGIWVQLGDRTDQANSSLYHSEATAPDQKSAETIRDVVTALRTTRAAVDATAEARLNSRTAEASDDTASTQAADRERLVSGSLTEARGHLAGALAALSAIV